MKLARVCGNLVSTLKHADLAGHRLLLVQPCDRDGTATGPVSMAIDRVDAGPGDWVLVLDEGSSASLVLDGPRGPVRSVIVGIVDDLHQPGQAP